MKTIGLIGGMSWESSTLYYQLINRKVKAVKGEMNSCKSILYTVDFAQIHRLQKEGDWKQLDQLMADAAQKLEKAGADIIILCANTMHLCSAAIQESVAIPFLHIAEVTGAAIASQGLQKIALLGTKYTMEKDFYKKLLTEQFGLEVLIPNAEERADIHRIIYDELVQGKLTTESRQRYQAIIKNLENQGAEGVILGCTEIPLLIKADDVDIPIFDTTTLHAEKAVEWALG